ncbi:hypothetical protein ABFU82_08440 [Nocardioides sp. WV_118_6]|uniref:hypothetical protein n=1 Tax=Nocardioides simplex TaxID=2045 RepID=UPI00214F8BC3|nr:hypothetical protein [Pimelobacter simplex]UUW88581.1 hypothetical protein M0M43_22995 [Pimelobacter simplex]UUW98086.1 hypothetical protein M0M48_11645 [Pimelobacter simplex]
MSAFARLLRVELIRLVRRRAVLVLLLVALVVPVVVGVAITLDTRPPSAAALADAKAQVERDRKDPAYAESLEQCIADPVNFGGIQSTDKAEIERLCTEQTQPQVDWYLYVNDLDLATEITQGSGIALVVILGLLMMVLGTTFTGHDWASGSVSNQLLFEPRRARVWAAKAIVVTGVALVLSALVLSAYWLGLNAVAASRDLPSGGAVLLDCLQMGWRGAGVVAAAALCGFALTMLFRSTVATLGILFGVALVGGIVLAVLGVSGRFDPALNTLAVVADGATYYVDAPCPPEQGIDMAGATCSEERTLTFASGAAYTGTAVGGSAVLSLLWFRRRDVP